MRRGFKTQAEKLALKHRAEFGITSRDRLIPKKFLEFVGLTVWTPADIPGIDPAHVEQLTVTDSDSWSGVTVREGDRIAIIVNPAHPKTRQANTLIHEWAHIELRHTPSRADRSVGGLLLLSDYPPELEEEADWLSACMLVPRDGLLYHCGRGLEADEIAMQYGVSTQLARWRIGKTGVKRQLAYR